MDFNKAIELNPNYVDAYYNRAGAKSKLGDILGAIIDYDQVIKLNMNDADAYRNRSMLKAKLGDN